MLKKYTALFLILLTLTVSLPVMAEEPTLTVGASFQTLNNVFYTALSDSIRDYVHERGGRYIAMDSQVNLEKQASDVEDMVFGGCDVIILAPIDSIGSVAAVAACQQAGVPVICVNSGVKHDYVASTIETDNYLAGVLMARSLIELSGGKACVGMLEYNLNDAGRQRSEGFLNTVASYPEIEIVARQECDTTTETALPLAEDMLLAHPEITAFFSLNDPTAYGVYSAAKGLDREDDLILVSCDGGTDVLEWIASGKIQSSVTQFPGKMGRLAAEAAYKLAAGESVESHTLVAPITINLDNLDKYDQYFAED